MSSETLMGVAVTAEMHTTVIGTKGTLCHNEGDEFTARPGVANQCGGTLTLDGETLCADRKWVVTIPAGEAYTAEIESGHTLKVKSGSELFYAFGTEDAPLVLPEDMAEIKVAAPELLLGNIVHTIGISATAEMALINCNQADAKVELEFIGC